MAKQPPSSASKAIDKNANGFPPDDKAYSAPQQPLGASGSQLSSSIALSLTDTTCALFVLVNLHPIVSLTILVAHSIASSSCLASSFSPAPSLFLVALSQITLYVLTRNHKHDYLFRHIFNAADAILAVHFLTPVSVKIVSSLANRKLSTRIVYNRSDFPLSTKFIAFIVSLVCLNYALWLLACLSPRFGAPSFAPAFIVNEFGRSRDPTSVWANLLGSVVELKGLFSSLNLIKTSTFVSRVYLWIAIHTIVSWVIMNPLSKPSLPESSWPHSPSATIELPGQIHRVDVSNATSMPTETSMVHRHNFVAFVRLPLDAKLAAIRLRLRALSIQLLSKQLNNTENLVSGRNSQSRLIKDESTDQDAAKLKKPSASEAHDTSESRRADPDTSRSTATTTASCTGKTFSSLTTTTSCPHCATIESVVSVQPLWLYIAACKAYLFKKSTFGLFQAPSATEVSIVRVDSSSIVCRVSEHCLGTVSVEVNGSAWPQVFCEVNGEWTAVVISGLTPRVQYKIAVFVDGTNVDTFLANTAALDNARTDDELSSLTDLQNSVAVALSDYQALCARSKQSKRDDNKRIANLKHQLESLNLKMVRYNSKPSNDVRKFGKFQGLKHAIAQLDGEIAHLEGDIEAHKQFQTRSAGASTKDDQHLTEQIDACRLQISKYDERMAVHLQDLRTYKQELQALVQKRAKLESKIQARNDEVRALQQELKSIKKNSVQARFIKRSRKAAENMEVILPQIDRDIQRLDQECTKLLDT